MASIHQMTKWFAIAIAIGVVMGCATDSTKTEQITDVTKSGFLSDYSILSKGGEGEAALIYINETADFKKYDKMMLEPVTIWLGPNSKLKSLKPEERKELASAFYAELRKVLEKDYTFVDTPSPDTMRVRVAITDAQQSSSLDTISNIVPQTFIVGSVASLATETAIGVGQASVEADVHDAVTGELLGAGVDRRAGEKYYGRMVGSWTDAKRAFEAWANQFSANLRKQRNR